MSTGILGNRPNPAEAVKGVIVLNCYVVFLGT